jgi:hypothetical protein
LVHRELELQSCARSDGDRPLGELLNRLGAENAGEHKRQDRRADENDAACGRTAKELLEGRKDPTEQRFERILTGLHEEPKRSAQCFSARSGGSRSKNRHAGTHI